MMPPGSCADATYQRVARIASVVARPVAPPPSSWPAGPWASGQRQGGQGGRNG
jgi:hypothetical protein